MNESLRIHGAGRLLQSALLGLLLLGCGSPEDRPPPSPPEAELDLSRFTEYDTATADARDVFATGGCDEGQVQTCRIYLPSHNGVQPCFVGEQRCVNAAWGDCGKAVLVDANADDRELDPDTLAP